MKDVVLVKRSRGIFRRAGGYELALADHKAQRILSVAHAARVREAAGVDGRFTFINTVNPFYHSNGKIQYKFT